MIKFLTNLISFNGNPSSKRFVGIVASLALIVYMFIWPSAGANDSVLILALGALGITSAEKIWKKSDPTKKEEDESK